jgi:hypothetical protein
VKLERPSNGCGTGRRTSNPGRCSRSGGRMVTEQSTSRWAVLNMPSGRCLAAPPAGADRPVADAHGNERTGLSETGLAEPHPKGPSDPDALRRQGGGEAGRVGPGGGLGACNGPRGGRWRAAQTSVAGWNTLGRSVRARGEKGPKQASCPYRAPGNENSRDIHLVVRRRSAARGSPKHGGKSC